METQQSKRNSDALKTTYTQRIVNETSVYEKKRSTQHVMTIRDKVKVATWMTQKVAEGDEKNLATRAVIEFPMLFNSHTKQANWRKSKRIFEDRDKILGEKTKKTVSRRGSENVSVLLKKALPGRGRKTSDWVNWLYNEVEDEFRRLRSLGVRFTSTSIKNLAIKLLEDSDSVYNAKTLEDGELIKNKINDSWVARFLAKKNIISRSEKGKKLVSEEKRKEIDSSVAFHLGRLKYEFENNLLDENAVENMDETHFVVDTNNMKTLEYSGATAVKTLDVVSGGQGMTMVVRITGGESSRVASPMLILENPSSSYPIHGLPDDIPGVCYRTGRYYFYFFNIFHDLNFR